MKIQSDDVILFAGDSITDSGRSRTDVTRLGDGYVFLAAAQLLCQAASPDLKIHNWGVGGYRIYDVESQFKKDLPALKPTILSLLIGINDTWRRYDNNLVSPTTDFQASYRRVLTQFKTESPEGQIILLEPFVLPVPDDRKAWREDLDPKITAVRELAIEFGAELVPMDGIFAEAATRAPAAYWMADGVHPTLAGHQLIAESWLDHAESD